METIKFATCIMRGKHTIKLAAKGYVRISRVLPLIMYAVLCQVPRTFKQNILMKKTIYLRSLVFQTILTNFRELTLGIFVDTRLKFFLGLRYRKQVMKIENIWPDPLYQFLSLCPISEVEEIHTEIKAPSYTVVRSPNSNIPLSLSPTTGVQSKRRLAPLIARKTSILHVPTSLNMIVLSLQR